MVQYKTIQVPVDSDTPTPTPTATTRQTKAHHSASTASDTQDSSSSGRDQGHKQQSASHNQSSSAYEPLPTFEKSTGGASASKLHQIDPDRITEEGSKERNVFKEDIHNVPFREGQTVEYVPIGGPNSHTGMSTGRIERVLTSKANAGDKNVAVNASKDQPQYEIMNDNTHKKTALKGKNLINVIDDPNQ